MSAVNTRIMDDNDESHWDDYVKAHKYGTFFHLARWRHVLEKGLGHKSFYILAEIDGKLVGVLPLAQVKSLLFGHSLVSTPFAVYGGILANSDDVASSLQEKAVEIGSQLNVDFIEFRNQHAPQSDWHTKDLYVTFRKDISDNDEENMQAIPRKQRAMVRKGIKAGLNSTLDLTIDNFFDAYSESVRNLGTPVFPKRYFKVITEVFANDVDILTVRNLNGDLVSSVMSFYYKNEVLPYYGGGTNLARDLKGNDFMYWDLMCHAVKKGARIFDYGRSKKGTGSYSFKKNWGFEPEDLHYSYKLIKAKELPDINPLNPKYQFFIKTWKKLPLNLANILGPLISRNLG